MRHHDWRRPYEQAIAGALGGWLGQDLWANLAPENLGSWGRGLAVGAVVGGAIGFALGAAVGCHDPSRAALARATARATLLGLVGGALGLMLSELVISAVGHRDGISALGWVLLGVGLGVARAWSAGSAPRLATCLGLGALGGLLGGLVAFVLHRLIPAETLGPGLAVSSLSAAAIGATLGLALALADAIGDNRVSPLARETAR